LGASWTLDDIDDALDYYNSYLSRDFASEWGDVHHSHHAGHGHDGQSHDSGNPGQGVDDDGSDGNTQVGSLFDHPSLQLIELGGSYLDHHDFGTVEVDWDGQVDLLDFAVINVGPETLNVSEVRLAGELDAYTFTGLDNGFSLEPYERQYVQAKFDPLSTGPKSAELTFVSNSGGGDFLVSLSGIGQSSGPDLRTVAMNNNLGGVLVNGGEKTVEDFITISNEGLQDLEITGIDIPGPQTDFAFADLRMDISSSNPLVLQPEESISLALKFDPSRLGLIPSEIQIESNSGGAPMHHVPIVGTGLGELARQLDFGYDYIAVLGGETLRGRTDRSGNYEFFVPAELDLEVSIFDPISQLISHQYDRTTASGRGMEIGTPHFTASREPDNDGDGLPKDIEEALGTSDENRDSNGDGISDYEAVIAGFDPLGPASRTGLIGSVDLGHPANDILFASNPFNGRGQLAYIATGDASGGLAVVDVLDKTAPFVISQLELPGIAQEIKIDEASDTLGLWNGTQAHLIDVREPTSPSLLLTLDDVGRFEFFDGHLFISRDSMLMSFNLQTMEMRDDRALAGQGAIVDMQRVGNLLYAMFGNGRLRIFELAADQSGRISERGEIRVFGTAGKIEVVGNVAYLMTTSGARRPFVTVDVSDPDNLSLLSEEDGGIILPRTDFTTAGGPFGFLVGRDTVAPFDHLFSVVDVASPAADTPRITQFVLPEKPRSVSLADGVAFVAHGTDPSFFQPVGTGGLQIFNFPSIDLNERPPLITLSTPHDFSVDAGIQLIEGETIAFTVDASDDVGVSHVELLLNGDVIGNDFSPPFEFNTALPVLPEGIDAFIQARAFDTGGNANLVDPIEIDIIPDNIAPRVINVEPKDGGFRPEGDIEVLVTLSEELSQNSFTADSFQVFDSQNQAVTPSEIRLQPNEISLLLESVAAGRYRVRSVLPLEDRAGNSLAPFESSFDVDNGSIHWVGVASELWEEPGNWSLGRIPGPSDDVVIGVPGDGAVRVSTSTIPSVRSIRSEQPIVSNRGLTLAADSILTGGLTSKFGPASSVITLGGELLLKGKSQIGAKFTGLGTVVNRGIFTFVDNEESELVAPFRNEGHVRVDATSIDIGSLVVNAERWEFRGLANLFSAGGEFVNHKDLHFSSPLTDVSFFAPFHSDGQEIHLPPNRKLELKGGGEISNTIF
ncbi:MAG: choice-of-anchor D domain-containing protein, partial [Planctomycetota bacterium]